MTIEISSKKRFDVLDSFRGLCACLVALSHFNANSLFNGTPIFESGSVYVDFFFVLSGFVIFANYEQKLRSGYSIGTFVFLRWGRVYPLHIAVLAAFVGIDLLQMVFPANGMAVFKPFSAPGEGLGDIAANIFLVHALGVSEHIAFNGPSWSISTEFYTYILFAFLIVGTGRFLPVAIAAIGLVCAVILFTVKGELYAKLDYGFLRCVYGFATGALTWMVFDTARSNAAFKTLMPTIGRATAIEGTVIVLALLYIHFLSQIGIWSMAAPIVFAALIWIFAAESGKVSTFLKKPAFLLIGTLSYSIYMVHIFISGKFFELPVRMLEARGMIDFMTESHGFLLYGKDMVTGTMFELFYLCIVVLCSVVSYKLIEEPCRNWSRRIANRMRRGRSDETPPVPLSR